MRFVKLPKNPGRDGLTLIEALLGLTLFLLIFLGTLDFFGGSRRLFFRIGASQDASERGQSALDRLRLDALESGRDLSEPIRLEIVRAVEETASGAVFTSAEKTVLLGPGEPSGTAVIPLASTGDFSAGRKVCLYDKLKAEIGVVQSVDEAAITLAAPPFAAFVPGETSLALLRTVEIIWDAGNSVLRRKVNEASAQPLLEDVLSFRCGYDAASNLLRIGLRLKAAPEVEHAVTIFPKNAALARGPGAP